MVYEVNKEQISAKVGAQLFIFVSQLGHYKTEDKDDYEGTTRMIDELAEEMKKIIPKLSTFDKIDLGLALSIISNKPALDLVNLCFENITQTQFNDACFQLITETKYFEKYEGEVEFIEESDLAIGIIAIYLRGVAKKSKISKSIFQKKFQELTDNLTTQLFGSSSKKRKVSDDHASQLPWREITLTTCGQIGAFGPSLEQCIENYKTEWCKDKTLFDVDPNRKGIQKLTVPTDGTYSFDVWGAGRIHTKDDGGIQLNKGNGYLKCSIHQVTSFRDKTFAQKVSRNGVTCPGMGSPPRKRVYDGKLHGFFSILKFYCVPIK